MKAPQILLIGLFFMLVNQLRAQESYPVDLLKKTILSYFDNDLIFCGLTEFDMENIFVRKITGKAILNDSAIVVPTVKGHSYLSYRKPLYLQGGRDVIIKNEHVNSRSAGNSEFSVEVRLNNKNYKDAYRLNKETEKFVASWNLMQIKLNTTTYDEKLNKFKDLLVKNKNLVNDSITEEQRKYIVQANYNNDKMAYKKALESYELAIKSNPFNYPDGYYNMALIASQSQIKDYSYAIFNMNKYLILVSNTEDTRKEKDQLYKWEMEINNNITSFTGTIKKIDNELKK